MLALLASSASLRVSSPSADCKQALERGVWRGDLWGRQLDKYKAVAEGTLENAKLEAIEPTAPYYLYHRQNIRIRAEYEKGMAIPEILAVNSVGVVTSRDHLAIHFTRQGLLHTVRNFASIDAEDARKIYALGKDVQDWKVAWAQEDVRASGPSDNYAVPILYRPFDVRWTYYTGKSSGFLVRPRPATMRNMLRDENIGLITSRLTKGESFQHAQVTDRICEVICMSPNTSNNGFLFPLYVRSDDGSRIENLALTFRAFLDSRYEHHYTPEEILGYVYAVLYAPSYRTRYAEFLRGDFPRLRFPEDADDFESLSVLGWALVEAHLLRVFPRSRLAAYHGKGDHTVEAVRYSPSDQTISINKAQFFEPVPREVWDFHIGGYQVLDKYLKSRKGRTLSLDEINHVGAIADSISFTIEQMAKIDEAYQAAFPARG
jgi:predicted helicase